MIPPIQPGQLNDYMLSRAEANKAYWAAIRQAQDALKAGMRGLHKEQQDHPLGANQDWFVYFVDGQQCNNDETMAMTNVVRKMRLAAKKAAIEPE